MWQKEGSLQDTIADANEAMKKLAALITYVREQYAHLTADELLVYPAPGKWSKQQVLGHLIDSAINNLKRFTEVQFSEQPYVIVPYRQNELVAVNHYQQLPWEHLLDLWMLLNRQIIFVVQNTPPDTLMYEVKPQYSHPGTQTLEWLICDYVAHMQRHLVIK